MASPLTRLQQQLRAIGIVLITSLLPLHTLYAQGMMGDGSCPMCGTMGWGGMFLGILFMIAIVGALIALTIFLVRRSRPRNRDQYRAEH